MLLRHIRYFLAVAEHQNFTRAAAALHVSQPTLSQQMQQLEESLGARLFDRSAKHVRLTDAGEAWKHYAKRALQDIDAGARAVHDVGTLVRGSLRFAAPPTFTPYLIGAAIDRFCRLYPGVTIHFSEIDQDQIEAWLADDKLDVGLGFDSVHLAEFDSTAIFLETLSFVVGATHRCARQAAAMTLTQFQAEPLVLLNQAFATRSISMPIARRTTSCRMSPSRSIPSAHWWKWCGAACSAPCCRIRSLPSTRSWPRLRSSRLCRRGKFQCYGAKARITLPPAPLLSRC